MILYFSGTGNSAHAAKLVGKVIGDEVMDLLPKLQAADTSALESHQPWVIAAPIYCWQLPHIVRDWMRQTEFRGSKDIYFVMTCGGEAGNAEKYLKELCAELGMNFKGCASVVMPENYIALFNSPTEREAEIVIKKADRMLKRAAEAIADGRQLPQNKAGIVDKLKSGPVNKIYYPLIVKDKKFYAEDSCTGCGLCERKCPLNNIAIVDGKPVWGGNCTHCMACISYCPTEAIEYGKASKGKRRYRCE